MSEFDLGRHEAMLETLDARTSRIEGKLDAVLSTHDERRGERKMLVLVASAAATLVSVLIAAGKALLGHP